MDFHFLHAADIHLDSPLRGLSAYEGAPVQKFRNATREAFRNLIDHAIDSRAAFIVIAGDLYDGDWPDFGTGLFLIKELERLRAQGIRAVILFGNHDADSRITRHLPWPESAFQFNHKKAHSIRFDDLDVVLHGQSFGRPDVTTNLVDGYPAPIPGKLNIGMLHTALEGNVRHASYAPCRLDQLRSHGYDYWALGHVHAFEILHRDPWVIFPGNLQGRNIRETGPKGCVSVSVKDGRIAGVEPVILDVARWFQADVDTTGCDGLDGIQGRSLELIRAALSDHGGRPTAVRIVLGGVTASHGELVNGLDQLENQLRAGLLGLSDCWLESVKIKTAAPAIGKVASAGDVENLLGRLLSDTATDPGLHTGLDEVLRSLREKLPADLLAEALADAEDTPLLAALRGGRYEEMVRAVLPDLLATGGGI